MIQPKPLNFFKTLTVGLSFLVLASGCGALDTSDAEKPKTETTTRVQPQLLGDSGLGGESPTPTPEPSPSPTATPIGNPTPTPTPSGTPTPSPTATPTPTPTATPTPTPTATPTPTPSPTATPTATPTPSPSATPTPSQTVSLRNGYQISLSSAVPTGSYSAPGDKWIFVPMGSSITITNISHTTLSPSQFTVSEMPEGVSGQQPFNPSGAGYNAALRLTAPLQISMTTDVPRIFHFGWLDPARQAANRYPHLSPPHNAFLYVVPVLPTADSLSPPVMGLGSFRKATFLRSQINAALWQPTVPLSFPTGVRSLSAILPEISAISHSQTPYGNQSGGQIYMIDPIGTPNSNGSWPTYGGDKSVLIDEILTAIMNPAEPAALREEAAVRFVQNIGLHYLAAAQSNFVVAEGGGQAGGVLKSAMFTARVMPSNSAVQDVFQQTLQQQKYIETFSLYQSPVDDRIYDGGAPSNNNDFCACAVGNHFESWGANTTPGGPTNWQYCGNRLPAVTLPIAGLDPAIANYIAANPALAANPNATDAGIGGSYQEIRLGNHIGLAFIQRMIPEVNNLGYWQSRPYVERMFVEGTQTVHSATLPIVQACFHAAINRFNSDPRVAVSGQYPPIPTSVAAQKVAELQARDGYFNMIGNYRYNPHYFWYQNLLGTSHP